MVVKSLPFILVSCILVVLCLSGCGGTGSASPSEAASPQAAATEPSPSPVLKVLDENGSDLGTAVEISAGAEKATFNKFLTENLGDLNPKVGWDDSALLAAGIVLEPKFEPEFGLYLSAEKEATAELRVYLSATDDWSDADSPPLELIITVNASANAN